MSRSRVHAVPQHRLRSLLPGVAMLTVCMYFAFYLMFSGRGYFALQQARQELGEKIAQHDALKQKRDALEADVKLMRPNSLDPDMADEQARRNLGYLKKDEIVIDLQ